MTFHELAANTRFRFHGKPDVFVKTSGKRYRDVHGTVHLCQSKRVQVETEDVATADEAPIPVKTMTPGVVADLWTGRKIRWKCPSCQEWVVCEMGKRCVNCKEQAPAAVEETTVTVE